MTFTPEQIEIANKTCRVRGIVGANALVPRFVQGFLKSLEAASGGMAILDFGAGTEAIHARKLQVLFPNSDIIAHEFGANYRREVHDPYALRSNYYDIVYASNVLNVQSDEIMLVRTLRQIQKTLLEEGRFIFNFPTKPRKLTITTNRLIELVGVLIGPVHNEGGGIYIATKKSDSDLDN